MAASAAAFDSVATAFVRQETPKQREYRERRKALIARGPEEGKILVFVDHDEWYPVFTPNLTPHEYDRQWSDVVEIDVETLKRWKDVQAAHAAMLEEIDALIEKVARPSPLLGTPTTMAMSFPVASYGVGGMKPKGER